MSVLITANQVCSNRVVIVSGHFGTGKTEFSVNYVMVPYYPLGVIKDTAAAEVK